MSTDINPSSKNKNRKWLIAPLAIIVIIMFISVIAMPGPLSPTMKVSASFGSPTYSDLFIERVKLVVSDHVSTSSEYEWIYNQNPNEVFQIPAVYDSESGYHSIYWHSMEIIVNCLDLSLLNQSTMTDNIVILWKYYNPNSGTWSTPTPAYPVVTATYWVKFDINIGIYQYASANNFVIDLDLYALMAE